jgi:hypothetical protein
MPETEKLYINGIDGATGQYLVPPFEPTEVLAYLKEAPSDPAISRFLRRIWQRISAAFLGLPDGVDPADVTQAGWAVVYHQDEDQAVRNALAPLVEHRRQQIGDESIVKVLTYEDGEDRRNWLARHDVAAGNVDPTKVPYYLLLVGSPERIPFLFGHLLDVEYAVGRLHFDTAEAYAAYVDSLIRYETGTTVPNGREVVYWSPRRPFDPSTRMSADLLVNPLAEGGPTSEGGGSEAGGIAQQRGFRTHKIWGDEATKGALLDVLTPRAGDKPPALLFTASHGHGVQPSEGFERQLTDQGALIGQDWPGLGTPVEPGHYLAARDVLAADARVHGMIAFMFACYGAGTPSVDRFLHRPGEPPSVIAQESFIAALPKALLSYHGGGALACIGHVERAWGYSIRPDTASPQLLPFKNALSRMLRGEPIGHAMRDFSERYAFLSTDLNSKLEELSFGGHVPDKELAFNWIERNDAEGYAVIGDPAAKLRVQDLE